MKNNEMNLCKKCGLRFHVRGNAMGQCNADETRHEAKYDFSKSEDVLECEIWFYHW